MNIPSTFCLFEQAQKDSQNKTENISESHMIPHHRKADTKIYPACCFRPLLDSSSRSFILMNHAIRLYMHGIYIFAKH